MDILIYYYLVLSFSIALILSRKQKKFQFLPFLILAIFSGFRYGVGADYFSYQVMFEQLASSTYQWGVEPGYKFLVLCISKIGGSQQLVFLIMSLATVYFTYKFIKEESPDFTMSSILYLLIGPFFLSSMNGIRQALAIAIFAYAISFLRRDKLYATIVMLLVASLFHSSVLLLLPIVFFLKKNHNFKNILALTISALIILNSTIAIKILELLSYDKFINYRQYNIDFKFYIFLAMGALLIIAFQKYTFPKKYQIYYNMGIISFILISIAVIGTNVSNVIFVRLNNYFFYSYLILVPLISNKFQKIAHIKKTIYLFSFIYFTYSVWTGVNMLPYRINFRLFNFG